MCATGVSLMEYLDEVEDPRQASFETLRNFQEI